MVRAVRGHACAIAETGDERMPWRACGFYCSHLDGLDREGPSAHRRPSRMGIIRLLKLFS